MSALIAHFALIVGAVSATALLALSEELSPTAFSIFAAVCLCCGFTFAITL
jgi:hypothetical protein